MVNRVSQFLDKFDMLRVIRCQGRPWILCNRKMDLSLAQPRNLRICSVSTITDRTGNVMQGSYYSNVRYQPAKLRADQLIMDLWKENRMQTNVNFRCAEENDIKKLVEIVQEQNWWYSDCEFQVLLKLDPCSLTVATDKQDTPIGFCGICNVLPGIIYNGPLIVRKEHQGVGIGKIFNKAMCLLQGNNNGCMDLDLDFVDHYGRKEFINKSYKFNCFQGIVSDRCRLNIVANVRCTVVETNDNDLPCVLDYDMSVYKGMNRERILRALLFDEHVHSVTAFCDTKVAGYGSLIKSTVTNNYSISHLFADNDDIVEKILEKLIEYVPNGSSLIIQIQTDKNLSERFRHFQYGFTMQRVFNKYVIETDLNRMYYVNDFML